MNKKAFVTQGIIGIVIGLSIATATSVFAAWTNPTEDPTGGNVTLSEGQWSTSGSDIYYSGGNVGIGDATPSTELSVVGEILSERPVSAYGNARYVYGDYGVIQRNDGDDFYTLLTDPGDQYGEWNSLRPFGIDLVTGNVAMADGKFVVEHSGGDVRIRGDNLVFENADSAHMYIRSDIDNNDSNVDPVIKFATDGNDWWRVGMDNSYGNIFRIQQTSGDFYTSGFGGLNVSADGVSIGTPVSYGTLHVYSNTGGLDMLRLNAEQERAGLAIYESGVRKFNMSVTYSSDRLYIADSDMNQGVYLDQNGSGWGGFSDVRLKENIKDYSVLDKLDDYRAVEFDWTQTGTHGLGVVAQEVYNIFPEVVSVGSDEVGEYNEGAWGVEYGKLGALALQAVKELHEKVSAVISDDTICLDGECLTKDDIRELKELLKEARSE